jgi:hypothetical protein
MAENNKKLNVTELDFDGIKTNLKTFLKGQDQFSDYDFEGSGMSVLLDALAYNTHYLAMNTNFAMNESFLDSATLRSSVVSHAKKLGYTPRSCRAPVAYLDVTLNAASSVTNATIEKGTKFTTTVDGVKYSFVTNASQNVNTTNGILRFVNLPVYEGTLVTNRYTYDAANPTKRFLITSERADTTTLKVDVQNSTTDTTTTTYTLATDISQVTAEAEVYFLQEVEDGQFEVYFGDGVVGKKLSDGNLVSLQYIVTNKTEANGARTFSPTGSIDGVTDISVFTITPASGGAEPETIASIKYNAPLNYSSQGRAVTANDYKVIIPQVYPATRSVQVWGGEDNDPPVYGQVYASIRTESGTFLTQAQKDIIINDLDRYNIASVRPVIVDPETTFIRLGTTFKYDANSTTKSATDLEAIVLNTIQDYNSSDLEKFDGVFRYSKLSRLIDSSDSSIISNISTVRMVKNITPQLNTDAEYEILFSNEIFYPLQRMITVSRPINHPSGVEVVTSTGFTVSGYDETMYVEDNGAGYLRMYYLIGGTTKTYVSQNVGTVDYVTGRCIISALNITGTSNSDGTVSLIARPASNDVASVRNQIIEIDFSNTSITGEIDTIVSGGSSAGTGYTTTNAY